MPLAPAQDHKRLGDGDTGPNTGGMGAFSPVPGVGKDLVEEIVERAVEPTLHALHLRGIDYRGVLYAGLMLTADGPKVLEYNVRFGDPEAQVVLPRLDCDLAALLAEAAAGRLVSEPRFVDDAAVTVVLAAEGYPTSPRTGDVDRRPRRRRRPARRRGLLRRRRPRDRRTAGGRVLGRHRHGPRPGRRPRPGLRRRGPDLLARHAVPHRHRRPPPSKPRESHGGRGEGANWSGERPALDDGRRR